MITNQAALILAVSANFFVQSSSYKITQENVVVPCFSDATCSNDFPGSKCVNYQCECMVENGCSLLKLRSASNKIGEVCLTDEDCLFEHSKCSTSGNCDCKTGWIPTEDQKRCIKAIPKPLGSDCIDTAQCVILNAECKNNTCQCSGNTHAKDGICYESKALGEKCLKTKECSSPNSQCVNEVCRCKENFIHYENYCLEPAKNVSEQCTENIQCSKTLGEGAYCLNSACSCMNGFEYEEGVNQCVQIQDDSSSSTFTSYSRFLICLITFALYFFV